MRRRGQHSLLLEPTVDAEAHHRLSDGVQLSADRVWWRWPDGCRGLRIACPTRRDVREMSPGIGASASLDWQSIDSNCVDLTWLGRDEFTVRVRRPIRRARVRFRLVSGTVVDIHGRGLDPSLETLLLVPRVDGGLRETPHHTQRLHQLDGARDAQPQERQWRVHMPRRFYGYVLLVRRQGTSSMLIAGVGARPGKLLGPMRQADLMRLRRHLEGSRLLVDPTLTASARPDALWISGWPVRTQRRMAQLVRLAQRSLKYSVDRVFAALRRDPGCLFSHVVLRVGGYRGPLPEISPARTGSGMVAVLESFGSGFANSLRGVPPGGQSWALGALPLDGAEIRALEWLGNGAERAAILRAREYDVVRGRIEELRAELRPGAPVAAELDTYEAELRARCLNGRSTVALEKRIARLCDAARNERTVPADPDGPTPMTQAGAQAHREAQRARSAARTALEALLDGLLVPLSDDYGTLVERWREVEWTTLPLPLATVADAGRREGHFDDLRFDLTREPVEHIRIRILERFDGAETRVLVGTTADVVRYRGLGPLHGSVFRQLSDSPTSKRLRDMQYNMRLHDAIGRLIDAWPSDSFLRREDLLVEALAGNTALFLKACEREAWNLDLVVAEEALKELPTEFEPALAEDVPHLRLYGRRPWSEQAQEFNRDILAAFEAIRLERPGHSRGWDLRAAWRALWSLDRAVTAGLRDRERNDAA